MMHCCLIWWSQLPVFELRRFVACSLSCSIFSFDSFMQNKWLNLKKKKDLSGFCSSTQLCIMWNSTQAIRPSGSLFKYRDGMSVCSSLLFYRQIKQIPNIKWCPPQPHLSTTVGCENELSWRAKCSFNPPRFINLALRCPTLPCSLFILIYRRY